MAVFVRSPGVQVQVQVKGPVDQVSELNPGLQSSGLVAVAQRWGRFASTKPLYAVGSVACAAAENEPMGQ